MYILDTDSLGEVFEKGQETFLGQKVAAVDPSLLFISDVTVEEMVWGRTDAIKKAVKLSNTDDDVIDRIPNLCRLYDKTVAKLNDWKVLPYDERAANIFKAIPRATRKGRLNDCRIAAVALANDFTVITKNQKDFIPIEAACGVKWDDWSIDPSRITPAA